MIELNTLTPATLKQLPLDALPQLAADIRQFLIASVSQTGGHIGAALSALELTLALHYVFESPDDKLLFDTGHQGYVHRILTGRAAQFSTLNTFGGMSRFLSREDSVHDILSASHAGTAVSTAVGLARAMRAQGDPHRVIAVVGDGTLGEGNCWEGLNYLAGTNLRVLVIINDNGYSIPKTVGGVAQIREALFDGLGFPYLLEEDGHDLPMLIGTLREIQSSNWPPCILHIKTEKGHGLPCAANHPYRLHFSLPFDPATGTGASPTVAGRTYATVAADALGKFMAEDPAIVVLTPATPYASGLEPLMQQYPERVIDVGMAEQHAVSMACGLALGGQKPVVCMQSTFLQRAYDQVLHDVCYPNLPVTFLVARSGFAGYDSPTHHGLWDIPVLRSFPHLQLHYATDTGDLTDALFRQLQAPHGPLALLHPYEPVPDPEPSVGIRYAGYAQAAEGHHGTIVCLGNTLALAHDARRLLIEQTGRVFDLLCLGTIAPFPRTCLDGYTLGTPLVTIEEGVIAGGMGTAVTEALLADDIAADVLRCGTGRYFVPAGSKQECAEACGLWPGAIVERMYKRWPQLREPA